MRSQYFRFAVLLASALALGGCETFTEPGAPDQSFKIDEDIQDLEEAFKNKGVTIISFYSAETEKSIAEAEKSTVEAEKATKDAADTTAAADKDKKEAADATAAAVNATDKAAVATAAAAAADPPDENAKEKAADATAAAKTDTMEAAKATAAAVITANKAAVATAAAEKANKEAAEATAKFDKKNLRNQFISQRLTLINIQYIKFIRRFAVEKAQLDTAADILIIGLNLAGTLVGAATTKGILAAIAGGTGASRTSINKNFFHEKTVPVLVTAMNAERAVALGPIMKGVGESIDDYRFPQALSDLHLYYQAGTFIGALQAIQRDSGAKEERAVITLRGITVAAVTKEMFNRRKALMNTIDGLEKDKAIALLPKIEAEFPEIKPFMARYDAVRAADAATGSKAKKLLKQAVPLTAKSQDDADKWQAAIDSL